MNKTKQELEALHRLFLSEDSDNWKLAATKCDLEYFNAVINMEIERLANAEDFEFSKTKDEDSDGLEYEHKLMLGVVLNTFVEWGRHTLDNWAVIERSWESAAPKTDIAWTELKYDVIANESETISYWTQDANDCRTKGPRNQYLTTDFESELEAVKEYWREQFLTIKNKD